MSVQDATNMQGTLALLRQLKEQMPEIWNQAQVVGQWVWVEFNVAPMQEIRVQLKELGFRWNGKRRCWQHPCGSAAGRAGGDPRGKYRVVPAASLELNDASPAGRHLVAKDFKVISLRECPLPDELQMCDTPDKAADYWRLNIATCPYFNPECECFCALLLNTRRKVKGHQLISIGTLDTILVHPREVFRVAVISSSAAVVLMHNHPSGDPTPSDGDIKATRDLFRAGQLMKIDVLDHVIVGNGSRCSLRELGYLYS